MEHLFFQKIFLLVQRFSNKWRSGDSEVDVCAGTRTSQGPRKAGSVNLKAYMALCAGFSLFVPGSSWCVCILWPVGLKSFSTSTNYAAILR